MKADETTRRDESWVALSHRVAGRRFVTTAFLGFLLVYSGCMVSSRVSGPEVTKEWPLQAVNPGPIEIAFDFHLTVNGRVRETKDATVQGWRASILRAFKESGLFSDVSELDAPSSERHVLVRIDRVVNVSRGVVLPVRASGDTAMMMTVRAGDGTVLGESKQSGAVLTQSGFEAMFAPKPGARRGTATVSELDYDMARAALQELYQLGIWNR